MDPAKPRRNRVPKLSQKPDSSGRYYVAFRGADGKPTRVRFTRSRKDSLPQYRRWLRANYGKDRTETGELITVTTPEEPTAATLKAVIAAYIAAEEDRVRPDEAERTQGTVGIDQFWDIRYQALQIGKWAKEHFGDRFQSVELAKLMDIRDYDAMMLHFIRPRKYKKSRVNKIRRRFWDMVRFAKGRPFHQELGFGRDQVKRYGGVEKKREREIPSVEVIRKILAVANTEQRTWIWIAVGCASARMIWPGVDRCTSMPRAMTCPRQNRDRAPWHYAAHGPGTPAEVPGRESPPSRRSAVRNPHW